MSTLVNILPHPFVNTSVSTHVSTLVNTPVDALANPLLVLLASA